MKRRNITWYETTDSTNNRALEGSGTHPDRYVWAADFQTAGRGQRGNKWNAVKGENLTFTILLKPKKLLSKDQFAISQICALGVRNYLENNGIEANIKWPNDIYVKDKKICGMLIENAVAGDRLSQSICGIGLNINQKEFPENIPNPTSLALEKETAARYNTREELPLLLKRIFEEYDAAESEYAETGKCDELTKRYLSRLYRAGEYHKYKETVGNRIIEAKIVGIDTCACLVLETKEGARKSYAFKEISYII